MAPLNAVWSGLIDPSEIEKWGAGPAVMSENASEEFSLWGGDIHGTNLEVVPENKLVQKWMSGTWKKFSKVTFRLTHKNSCTKLTLKQSGVPDEEVDETREGWDKYYLGPLKEYLEKK